ncbi:FecR domain-containing protein [Pseudomonas sp. ABC1]|uniref:FecR domain-containing protein n=1 Tax=Pseudomonas sp. ABC1 TaxID=2748080 RepID=UPI0015C3D6CA|nr:FecR domain-containing protein [Pseudomonas sp. ABC1]QLF93472.1 FecR domain-containing protein [Pseudomonas sp. ABC1]
MSAPSQLPANIRDQAIAWLVQEQSGCMNASQHEALQQWRQSDPLHELAWQRMGGIGQHLERHRPTLGDAHARQVLQAAPYQPTGRRQVLKGIVGLGLLGGASWQVGSSQWLQSTLADQHTATGERRELRLADGTQLWLNTRSALDIDYNTQHRHLWLRHGEVDIRSASDPRPLLLTTTDALLRPLGTHFSVRHDDAASGSLLRVSDAQVEVTPRHGGPTQIIDAGWQVRILAGDIQPRQPARDSDNAWIEGLIVAERMRLGDFIAELSRYRPGILRCDPAVAELRLTGSYPLDDTDRILAMLQRSLPVGIRSRSRYWVTITPRHA